MNRTIENKEAVFDGFTRKDKKGVKGVEDNPGGKGTVFIVEIPR